MPQQPPKEVPEYDFKATWLLNFARFVEWPAKTFEKETTPFVVGVLGDDPFTKDELAKALKDKTIGKRSFEIRKSDKAADLKGCQIVFIPATENGRLDDILDIYKGLPILTVAEKEDSARKGTAFNILIKNKKPVLELNNKAAEAAGLKVSSQVRDWCEKVDP
jgi:hypothetical protein